MKSRASRGRKAIIGTILIILATGGISWAGPKKTADGWTFQVSPYFWMSGIKGDVGAFERVPPSSIDVSFSDIFSHIDWPAAVMVAGEARHGRFGILGDVIYVELDAGASTPGPLFGSGTLKVKDFTSTIEGAYRVVDSPSVKLDGLAGVRIFSIDNELSLSSGILAARSGSNGDTWADPVVGTRAIIPFGGSGFFANAYGDVGGFGISGDLTWQLYGGIGYNFNNWLTGYAGYRYLDIHREDGGFVFDVAQQGPLLGAAFRF